MTCEKHYPKGAVLAGRCFACRLEEWLLQVGQPYADYRISREGDVEILHREALPYA